MQFLKDYPRKKITLQEIEQHYLLKDYRELYDFILSLIEQEVISPIKSSGRNGKKPSLYKSYRLKISLENEKTLQDEVTYVFHPLLNQEYYLNHLKQYQLDRESILKINDFFKNKRTGNADNLIIPPAKLESLLSLFCFIQNSLY